jgi:hypothetical protein
VTTDTYDVGNPAKPTILKDPDAVLDYTFDWTLYLDDIVDTLSSRTIVVPSGITKVSDSIVGKTVVVWLSGGTVGTTYRIVCRIVTVGGRTDDRSIFVKIKDR